MTLGSLALSDAVFQEFIDVLFRKKFDRYFFDEEERLRILDKTESNAVFFSPTETINICSDPKDNMFLELAIAADASFIITGDKHLLELHPFGDIPILTASEFIERF
ncbi:MAG: putative toxin-antitoxin system toxin component, PIN family [Proteiniphilum sp.]